MWQRIVIVLIKMIAEIVLDLGFPSQCSAEIVSSQFYGLYFNPWLCSHFCLASVPLYPYIYLYILPVLSHFALLIPTPTPKGCSHLCPTATPLPTHFYHDLPDGHHRILLIQDIIAANVDERYRYFIHYVTHVITPDGDPEELWRQSWALSGISVVLSVLRRSSGQGLLMLGFRGRPNSVDTA